MITIFTCLALIVAVQGQQGCVINISNLNKQPIVLNEANYQFLYPPPTNQEGDRSLTIPIGRTMIITCPGGTLTSDRGDELTIYAACNQDSRLVYGDKWLNFSSLSCSNDRLETVKYSSEPCGPDAVIMAIGYEISLNINFVPLITICFDVVRRNPLWTNYHLTSSIALREIATVTYVEDQDIYNLGTTFQQLYDVDYQRTVINGLVGLPAQAHKYIDYMPFYLEPLSRPICFLYRFQISASAHYLNTVPQWVLPGGYYNWGRTETSILQFAGENQLDLDVFTGTYGVSTLPHEQTGEDVEIYLYDDGSTQAIPVPALFWKLIHDPLTKRATVFLTINNPYETNITKNIICDDISDGISWLTWIGKDNIYQGYSYACTYHELKETLTYLPDIDVSGILV